MFGTTQASPAVKFTDSPPQQDCDPFLDSTLVKVIKTIAYSALSILALGGNSLVIAVIYRNRKLRTVINFLILNMAISDLLLPVFGYTRLIKQVYLPQEEWPLDGVIGSITCKLGYFAETISLAVSVMTLEVITLERFFGVVFPLKRQPIRSNKTCAIVMALIWLIGAAYSSLYIYSFKLDHRGTTPRPYCIYSWEPAFDNAEAVKVDYTVFLVAFTMIPFLLLTSLYSAIIISLHRETANLQLAPQTTQHRAKENRRITYMLVTVVVVILVTWLPLNVCGFLSAFVWSSRRPCEWRHLIFSAVFLYYSYPAVNPFIYCIFMENYREGFQELLSCLIKCRSCYKNQSQALPETGNNINCTDKPWSSKAVANKYKYNF